MTFRERVSELLLNPLYWAAYLTWGAVALDVRSVSGWGCVSA